MSVRFAIAASLVYLANPLLASFAAATPPANGCKPACEACANQALDVPPTSATSETPQIRLIRAIDQLLQARTPAASQEQKPFVTMEFATDEARAISYAAECAPDATVASTLRKAVYPRPIDFSKVKIAVHRPRRVANEGATIEAEEILCVEWDEATAQPTETTNHRLKSGDRLVVSLPKDEAAACAATAAAVRVCVTPFETRAAALPALPQVIPQPTVIESRPIRAYSVVPATGATSPPVALTPAYVSQVAIAPLAKFEPAALQPKMVQFDIVVIEDLDNNFAEFDELTLQSSLMLADTATMRGTLRILEKNKLVQRVSAPKLMTTCGSEANFEVGGESSDSAEPWQGIKTNISARELGGGLAVDFSFKKTTGQQTNNVRASLIVPHGQTVVVKAGCETAETGGDEDWSTQIAERAVYVLLTPTIVK